jgi:hypothetical protein
MRRKAAHLDQATITAAVSKRFDQIWSRQEGRLSIVPGKEVLARINTRLQDIVGITVSDGQIAHHFQVNEIHPDIRVLVDKLADFSLCNV